LYLPAADSIQVPAVAQANVLAQGDGVVLFVQTNVLAQGDGVDDRVVD
jgi:hypothetical protein